MSEDLPRRARYGEAFWWAHHESWMRSDLNQREYCEAQSLSLKAFGNWRAKFTAEPEAPVRKLLWRRGMSPRKISTLPRRSVNQGHGYKIPCICWAVQE